MQCFLLVLRFWRRISLALLDPPDSHSGRVLVSRKSIEYYQVWAKRHQSKALGKQWSIWQELSLIQRGSTRRQRDIDTCCKMEDDRDQADLGIAADIEATERAKDELKQPRRRFVGRRTAAEGALKAGSQVIPSSDTSIQGKATVLMSPPRPGSPRANTVSSQLGRRGDHHVCSTRCPQSFSTTRT